MQNEDGDLDRLFQENNSENTTAATDDGTKIQQPGLKQVKMWNESFETCVSSQFLSCPLEKDASNCDDL